MTSWRLLPLLLLACGLAAAGEQAPAPAPAEDPAPALAKAREDLTVARTEFKRLARVEQAAIRDARATLEKTKRGAALAPAFSAAADVLEAAAAEDGAWSRLCRDMAESYRALARELDAKERYLDADLRARKAAERAADTASRALALLAAGAQEEQGEEVAAAWRIVRAGDPRFASLARNHAALAGAFATLAERKCESAAVDRARKLHESLAPYFEGVDTERPPPPPAMPAPCGFGAPG